MAREQDRPEGDQSYDAGRWPITGGTGHLPDEASRGLLTRNSVPRSMQDGERCGCFVTFLDLDSLTSAGVVGRHTDEVSRVSGYYESVISDGPLESAPA